MQNILTIDVEDYFQVASLSKSISVNEWESITPRVVNNSTRLLDLFDEMDVKVTHFVLGWVAERFPDLVKEIHARGHEIASHGYSHQLIYDQSPEVFHAETLKSKSILEDIIGEPVLGYRAASYSITSKSLWALDILVEAGFKYDSSIFPVRHDRYGIPGTPTVPYILTAPSGGKLIEIPLSTYNFLGYTLPVSGGGYFRLYPYYLTKFFLQSLNKTGKSFVFYLHPWEIDPDQPRVKASWLSEFRHYNNLDKCHNRLHKLINDFSFTTMDKKIHELDLYNTLNNS